ncbi:odorant receptor 67a-like [Drosophila subpulchrella]|uniref:odorant receptor 67a-like n=1 Tax=Drosophila subpulchrella TaxID=1486046 RepID=UPI0018A1A81A|nr:odorant receptor 67a-like [Drosophila subpulchrella]
MSISLEKKIFAKEIGATEKSKKVFPVADDFLRLARFFFHSMGVDPYESDQKTGLAFQLYLVFHVINLFFIWFSMMVFVTSSVGPNADFLHNSMVVGYITFGNVGVLKITVVQLQKGKLSSLVRHMNSLFPPPVAKEQKQYAVGHYMKFCNRISKGFAFLMITMVITNSLSPITQYAIQRFWLHSPNAELALPYVSFAPWNWRESWKFWPTYLLQSIAAYTCTCGYISADLMMFAVVIQVIMHFDRLATALREFNVRNNRDASGAQEDLKDLRSLIAYHIQVLETTDLMNKVFGVVLLLNFINSSLLVCNVGFQLTVGFNLPYFGRQVLIILSALVEIYLICFLSQMLINAVCSVFFILLSQGFIPKLYLQSNNVSFAVYDMNWIECDPRFRKMLLFIAMRSQKPVCLHATVFLDISMETMTSFIQVSYKFFCAIRMMYQ